VQKQEEHNPINTNAIQSAQQRVGVCSGISGMTQVGRSLHRSHRHEQAWWGQTWGLGSGALCTACRADDHSGGCVCVCVCVCMCVLWV